MAFSHREVASFMCRYVLACIETQVGIRRGDRVWQLAFGSGFKANSAVWRARKAVHRHHEAFLPPQENSGFSAHA